MIEIGGEQHRQPTDWTISSFDGDEYATITNGNIFKRVKVSDLLLSTHDHDSETLRPLYIQPPAGDSNNSIRLGYSSNGSFSIIGGRVYVYTANDGQFVVTTQRGMIVNANQGFTVLSLQGTVGYRSAIADSWQIYPCFESSKTDIVEIPDTQTNILDLIRGITFKQEGVPGIGVTVEDLQKFNLPGLVEKDTNGDVKAINPMGLIPILVQAVKRIRVSLGSIWSRITDHEGRLQALENRIK